MKNYLALILCCLALNIYGQNQTVEKKLRIKGFQVTSGFAVDEYRAIDRDFISSTATDPSNLNLNLDGLNPTFGKRSVSPTVFVNLVLSPQELNNTSFLNRSELLIGMGFHGSREMRAGYSSEDLDTTINFCNISNESSIEIAYLVNFFGKKATNLFAGIGSNLSATYNNEVMIISGGYIPDGDHPAMIISRPENELTFAAQTIVSNRIYGVLGTTIHLSKRGDMTFQYRPGVGLQFAPDQPMRVLPYTGGFNIGIKYYFKERNIPQHRIFERKW